MNTERFDVKAATWDTDPEKVTRANRIAAAIADTIDLDNRMRLLEYGAGTGLVTQVLQHSVGPVTLADTSPGMRQVIGTKIESGMLAPAQVWDLDLQTQPPPQEQFDLIVTALALHHIPDVATVLAAFARMLTEDGYLCIADLDAEDGSFHDYDFEGHHGFDRGELTRALNTAGFSRVSIQDCAEVMRGDVPYSVFLAVAQR